MKHYLIIFIKLIKKKKRERERLLGHLASCGYRQLNLNNAMANTVL